MSYVCNKCHAGGFATYDEALVHETKCTSDRHQYPAQFSATTVEDQSHWVSTAKGEQKKDGEERKLNSYGEGVLGRGICNSEGTVTWLPSSSAERDRRHYFEPQILLSQEELSYAGPQSPAQNLSLLDSYACKNIEVFEATEEDVSRASSASTGSGTRWATGGPIVGNIGIRCIHCSNSSAATAPSGTMYPVNIGGMATDLRFMAENHFPSCSATPELLGENMSKAAAAEQEDAERDTQWRRIALLEFCVAFCKKMSIANRSPSNTGLLHMYAPNAASEGKASSRKCSDGKEDATSSSAGLMVSTDDTSTSQGTEGTMMALTPLATDTTYQTRQVSGHPKQQNFAHNHASEADTSNISKDMRTSGQHSGENYMPPSPRFERVTASPQAIDTDQKNNEGPVYASFMKPEIERHSDPNHGHMEPATFNNQHSISQNPFPPSIPTSGQHQPPPESAFFHDGYAWTCRYCCNIPYIYRAPQSVLQMPSHVQPDFGLVQQHLRMCQGSHPPKNASSMQDMQHSSVTMGPPPSHGAYSVNQGNELRVESQCSQQQVPPYPPQCNPPLYPNQSGLQQGGAYGQQSSYSHGGPSQPCQEWGAPIHHGTNPHFSDQHQSPSAGSPRSYYSASLPVVPDQSHPPQSQYPSHASPPFQGGLTMSHHEGHSGPPRPLPYYSTTGSGFSGRTPARPPHKGPESTKPTVSDAALQDAIAYMNSVDRRSGRSSPSDPSAELGDGSHRSQSELVSPDDKLILTDYFYYIMKQLQTCRFSEADRKTRGGKRENVAVGFAGLQCIHCATTQNSRKFFWSNVDRLANSFAEIPGHVLKCRRCPAQTKEALNVLKLKHQEQMTKRPRGSQKVFFRRMWRRLHTDDATLESSAKGAPTVAAPASVPCSSMSALVSAAAAENVFNAGETPNKSSADLDSSSSGDAGGVTTTPTPSRSAADDSSMALDKDNKPSHYYASPIIGPHERLAGAGSFAVSETTEGAARALAGMNTGSLHSASSQCPPRIMLAIEEDKDWLSDMDCLIRRNVEVFCATSEDVVTAQADRKYPITVGQVGIRCIHCALMEKNGARENAVSYPHTINGLYESVREFQRVHLEECKNLTAEVRSKLHKQGGATSLSSVLRRYYFMSARALGMYDSSNRGIRAGGKSVAVDSTAVTEFTTKSISGSGPRKNSPMPRIDSYAHVGNTVMNAINPGVNGSAERSSHSHVQLSLLPYESRKRKSKESSLLGREDSPEDSPRKRVHIEEV